VLGEEQVLDVELDRKTELLPVKDNKISRRWETQRHKPARSKTVEADAKEEGESPCFLHFI
jgi:hypothetical protein